LRGSSSLLSAAPQDAAQNERGMNHLRFGGASLISKTPCALGYSQAHSVFAVVIEVERAFGLLKQRKIRHFERAGKRISVPQSLA
jgi:hypothetical protein